MNKKIFITGSGGFVGKNLYKILKNDFKIFGVDRVENECVNKVLDISDSEILKKELDSFYPDVIVHLAALSNVEKCETERELSDKQNILPIEILVNWASKNNKKIIFMSSDYVYDGENGNFDETSIENPIQYYGLAKLRGEKMVSTLNDYVILRPTVIYGWDENGMNFLMQMYRNQLDKKEMKVPIDQISNPTYVLDLCRLVKVILEKDVKGKFISTGGESYSRYDFALKICKIFGWDSKLLLPVETKFLGQVARRPLNNSVSNRLITNKLNFKFGSLEENLEELKKYFSI